MVLWRLSRKQWQSQRNQPRPTVGGRHECEEAFHKGTEQSREQTSASQQGFRQLKPQNQDFPPEGESSRKTL
ncbi:hypothetical protein MHYP_G00150070 [Metynnis hypsauchen]